MKQVLALGLLLTVLAGCSKKEPASVATPEAADTPPAEAPATPAAASLSAYPATPPPPGQPLAQPQPGVKPMEGQVDVRMTALLHKFMREKGRMPESILELGGATSDGFPLAPAGFLYAIDPATAQVKLVKQ